MIAVCYNGYSGYNGYTLPCAVKDSSNGSGTLKKYRAKNCVLHDSFLSSKNYSCEPSFR